jgi:hypothetical protein
LKNFRGSTERLDSGASSGARENETAKSIDICWPRNPYSSADKLIKQSIEVGFQVLGMLKTPSIDVQPNSTFGLVLGRIQ